MESSRILSICTLAVSICFPSSGMADIKKNVFHDCEAMCPEMVQLPAGTYTMGATEAEAASEDPAGEHRGDFEIERPQHIVSIKAFAVGRYDVTRTEFAAFIADSGYKVGNGCARDSFDTPSEVSMKSWRDPGFRQTDRDPVVCVSWSDANAYAAWLSRKTGHAYRLLSEQEWEYAARAGTKTARYWGDNVSCKYANTYDLTAWNDAYAGKKNVPTPDAQTFNCSDRYVHTSPVGSFLPNEFGLYDMLGNVEQWVFDCFGKYGRSTNESLKSSDNNCQSRVTRGGSSSWGRFGVRAASRNNHIAIAKGSLANRFVDVGFRVARDL